MEKQIIYKENVYIYKQIRNPARYYSPALEPPCGFKPLSEKSLSNKQKRRTAGD